MHKTETEWIEEFKRLGAYWRHDGNPKRPHALLTSGNHSNGFFNATKVTEQPRILDMACSDLLENLHFSKHMIPHKVIGSAMGAITIAHEFGRQLGIRAGFTEPVEDPYYGKQMKLKRFNLARSERVLVVEDVLTTGATTEKTITEIKSHDACIYPMICVLVNRSGKRSLGVKRVVSLINRHMPIWAPEECPLCKDGSEAVRPKDNWDRLTAEY